MKTKKRKQVFWALGIALLCIVIVSIICMRNQYEQEIYQPRAIKTGYVQGIDISHWQGTITNNLDTNQLDFIICKATQGTKSIDPMFITNKLTIRRLHKIPGYYHFYEPDEDPIDQAKHFLSVTMWDEYYALPPIVDLEIVPGDSAAYSNDIWQWLHYVEKRTGKTPIIYGDCDFLDRYVIGEKFERFPLWIADWSQSKKPCIPFTWSRTGWTFWQKTNAYKMDGQLIDFDLFNGSVSDLIELTKSDNL